MKNALAGIVALVFAGGIAASCSDSNDGGQPGNDAGREGAAVSCGVANAPCCNGAACDNGLTCSAGTCSGSAGGDAGLTDATPDLTADVTVADGSPGPEAGGDAASADSASTSPCGAGEYKGPFSGTYSSSLTGVGIPVPVAGSVDMTLEPEGSAQTTCMLAGRARACGDLFSVQNGTVAGWDDQTMVGDAGVGGFPYFCTITGTLDCENKELVNGWIQCTYCVGPLADGGTACALLGGVGGSTGVGGHFAGTLTAGYDHNTLSFVMGAWNGAQALAGNDGGSPGPDGGPISNYLSDSGVYLGPGNFGGSGTWSATHQ